MGEPKTLAEDLDELFTVMRKHGCLKFSGTMGTSPVEVVLDPHHGRATAQAAVEKDDPLDAEVKAEETREQREEKYARKAWADHWRRMTLSSGGQIPNFPGVGAALNYLGRGVQ